MKKLNLQYVILFFVAMLLLSSCIGDKRNVISTSAFGVIRFDYGKFRNVLDVSANESFYHIQFQTAAEGDCFWVYYELDYDLPENSMENVLDADGNYTYTISLMLKESVDLGTLYYTLMDTSTVLANEVAIIEPMSEGAFWYIKGNVFLVSTLEIPDNQTMWWDLSYDYTNMVSESGNRRYYDLYLRATIRDKGTKTPEQISVPIAFDMYSYLSTAALKEKELGGDAFTIRIHYPSAISEDGIITWDYQDTTESIPVAYFID